MEKIKKLREALVEKGLDALLVTSTYNRRYLTNFTGSSGVALITKDKALFITDFRYVEQATSQCEGFEIVKHEGLISSEVASQVEKNGVAKIGFEQDHMTFSEYGTYRKVVAGAELVPVNGIIENLRLIKTDAEISIIKEATKIAESAFDHILGYIRPGVTELEVSNELEFYMRKLGATSSSFDIIVASGARSALPHGVASSKVIETGDFVTLDFGAYYKGYVSDILNYKKGLSKESIRMLSERFKLNQQAFNRPYKLAIPGKKLTVPDKKAGDYEKHPFFVKKANAAKSVKKTFGFPKQLATTK